MNPDYAHRMDGEGPIPGTRAYAESLAYAAGGGGMGMGYPPGPMMGGAYGGAAGAGMYGQPRGSWYGGR